MTNRDQLSVALPPVLRDFIARTAEEQDRSMSSVIRRLVAAECARARQAAADRAGRV